MSRVGRTLTAPAPDDDRPVRFAFVSCQDVTNSALNAYRRMIYEDVRRPRAERLSFVLHLGDFIYEIGEISGGRARTASTAAGASRYCSLPARRKAAQLPLPNRSWRLSHSLSQRSHGSRLAGCARAVAPSCPCGTIMNSRGRATRASSSCSTIRLARRRR